MALRFLNSGYFAGNVGIGTESPVAKLELGTNDFIMVNTGADGRAGILFNETGTPSATNVQYGARISYAESGDVLELVMRENNVDKIGIAIARQTGNVGIGTATSINNPLTVSKDAGGNAIAYFNSLNADGYGVAIQTADAGNDKYILRLDSAYSSAPVMYASNAGNVGIGTDSPGQKLTVEGNIELGTGGYIYGDTTTSYLRLNTAVGSLLGYSNAYIGLGPSFVYNVGGSEKFRISSANGNVGINTTTPDFKLDVDGTFGVSNLPFNTDSVSVLVADEIIGVEEVTNGSFTTDADWAKGTGWAIGGGTANGTSAVDPLYQTISGFTAGNTYKVRFEVTAVTSGYIRVYAYVGTNGTFTNIFNSTSLTTGVYESTFEFGGTNKILRFYGSVASTGGFTGSIDNISVKQVTSASNQIQKRELGTGAFGPTPVGAYLPLTAGSGFPLTGDLYLDTPAGASQSGYALKLKKTSSSSVVQVGAEIFATPWASNTNGGTIIFKNADSATNLQETLRISANGSVGINSTSSSYKLDVGGNARFQDSVYINTSTGAGGLYVTRLGGASESLKISTTDSTSVFETFQDENTGSYGSMAFILDNGAPDPSYTFRYGSIVRFKIEGGTGDVILKDALLSNQKNTNVDTGAEVVALVSTSTYTAAFFDFVVKKGTNVRSGTVYACHNGDTTPLVEFTETSTNDLGDTSDVTLSVDISGTNMRLLATVTSDDWSVKSLIRAI